MRPKILINGIEGQMGQALLRAVESRDCGTDIAGGVDLMQRSEPYRVWTKVEAVDVPFDVVVDFSVPAATERILKFCVEHDKPLVIATTGLGEDLLLAIDEAAKRIPVFRSRNMSLGVNLLVELVKQAKRFLGDDFDVEIVEMHHNRKLDAPSGTALMLADAVASCTDREQTYVCGRQDAAKRRSHDEIGIHSLRGGTMTGEHEVWFMGEDEAVVIKHQAFSRRVFATGALRAAVFLADKEAGLYGMQDLINACANGGADAAVPHS